MPDVSLPPWLSLSIFLIICKCICITNPVYHETKSRMLCAKILGNSRENNQYSKTTTCQPQHLLLRHRIGAELGSLSRRWPGDRLSALWRPFLLSEKKALGIVLLIDRWGLQEGETNKKSKMLCGIFYVLALFLLSLTDDKVVWFILSSFNIWYRLFLEF